MPSDIYGDHIMHSELGNRMKNSYEDRAKSSLLRRTPVIIRVDGKAFHTYTRGCAKPFDQDIINCMSGAAKALASELQGFKMGFVQSDEASFLLTDYDQLETEAWFDYKVQKMASVAASIMTAHFNAKVQDHLRYADSHQKDCNLKSTPAFFDARVFNIPENEVANYFLWRAKDWERNSLQMYARANFSQKELHGKNRQGMHDMLHSIGKNWTTDLTDQQKNGTWIAKNTSFDYSVVPTWESIFRFMHVQMHGPVPDAMTTEDILWLR